MTLRQILSEEIATMLCVYSNRYDRVIPPDVVIGEGELLDQYLDRTSYQLWMGRPLYDVARIFVGSTPTDFIITKIDCDGDSITVECLYDTTSKRAIYDINVTAFQRWHNGPDIETSAIYSGTGALDFIDRHFKSTTFAELCVFGDHPLAKGTVMAGNVMYNELNETI